MLVNHADNGRQSAREKDLYVGTVKILKFSASTQMGNETGSRSSLEV